MPKVSIAMGIHNCASTLSEAIDSLLVQTFDDWELVMCDDGSTGETPAIARGYCERYSEKIKLLSNGCNLGLNKTLNRRFEECREEYIARMDGDDISLPERFEKEVTFLDEHPEYAIVSTQMVFFDEGGDFMVGTGGGEPRLEKMALGTPLCHAPCMVRREAYEAVGGYVERDDRIRVEDWDLWVRMYELGYRGYNLSELLYKMCDDRNAKLRRKFRYRINEARVGASAEKKLGLSKKCYLYTLRPIIVGLLPGLVYDYLHVNRGSRK